MAAQPPAPTPPTPLAGYEVLLCVSGGIAAYKAAAVVSTLVQEGCGVSVAMTRNARRFVGPVTFEALSGRPVATTLWLRGPAGEHQHIRASETADLILVAPATANVIGKLAAGIADDLVSTTLLGAQCPVLLAPAMNLHMWEHPAVRRNVAFLRDNGFQFIGPAAGWLSCRAVGPGRMSEPDEIVAALRAALLKSPPRRRSAETR